MRINTLFIAFLLTLNFSTSRLEAQEVSPTQQSLVVKKTATWCSNCGSWGWTWFKDILAEAPAKGGICLNLHSTSSGLKALNNLDGDWLSQFDVNVSFPTFYVNGIRRTSVSEVLAAVEASEATMPIAGVGVEAAINEGNLKVTGKVSFYEEVDAEFYLGFYIIEDSVVHSQSAQGANAIHRYIVREAMNQASFGELISEGMVADGTSLSTTEEQMYEGMEAEKHSVLAVLWSKANNKYTYVNAWQTPVKEGFLSSVGVLSTSIIQDVFPNPAKAGGLLHVPALADYQSTANIGIYDLSGKQVFARSIQAGQNTIELPKNINSGIYFLRVENSDLSWKFIVE
jgi:hypothetical protein